MLLEKSPNVNAVDADGMAALAHACKEGHEDVAVKLLTAGAYTNVQVGCCSLEALWSFHFAASKVSIDVEERLKSNLNMRVQAVSLACF